MAEHVRLPLRARTAPAARWLLVALGICLLGGGCVQRRLTIRSNPPGALVYIDNYQIGTTPVSTDYLYYGTREIRLEKDGYETLTVKRRMVAPWYEIFPLDFFSECVVPGEIRDERSLDFNMSPSMIVPTEQVLGRAQDMRAANHGVGAIPPPQLQPPTENVWPEWQPNVQPIGP